MRLPPLSVIVAPVSTPSRLKASVTLPATSFGMAAVPLRVPGHDRVTQFGATAVGHPYDIAAERGRVARDRAVREGQVAVRLRMPPPSPGRVAADRAVVATVKFGETLKMPPPAVAPSCR